MGEKQAELFQDYPKTKNSLWQTYKRSFFNGKREGLLISQEQIIFFACGVILLALFSYSFGVSYGKKLAKPHARQEIAAVNEENNKQPQEAKSISQDTQKAQPQEELIKTLFYTVQVATYTKESHAEKEIKLLETKGLKAFVLPKGGYYQVCVGNYATSKDASKELTQLRQRYEDAFIKKLNESVKE